MTEMFEEEGHNKNYNSNQFRSNNIKTKKNSLGQDKEQLYAQNLSLRNRIKQMAEINIKMKTQLSITEKEKLSLCNIAEDQIFHPKLANRSQSGKHKKSATNIPIHQLAHQQPFFNNSGQKQKQNATLKKMIREQTIDIEKLNNENQRLKKTMKHTRMTEILTENQELKSETLRLMDIISEKRQFQSKLHSEYVYELDAVKKRLSFEKDSEKRNGYELKKQIDVTNELKGKIDQLEAKKGEGERRLNRQNKSLRNQISEVKSKLYQKTIVKGKECDREECLRVQREKAELGNKKLLFEKEMKKLRDDLENSKRQVHLKDKEISKMQQEMGKSRASEKQHSSTVPIKKDDHRRPSNQSRLFDKKAINSSPQSQDKNRSSLNQETKKSPAKQNSASKIMDISSLAEKNTIEIKKEEELKDKHESPPKKESDTLVQPTEPVQSKKVDQSDSMDTEKLLESFNEQKPIELNIESGQKTKEISKYTQLSEDKQSQKADLSDKNLMESDGQYEELNYDEFEAEEEKPDNVKEKKDKGSKKKQSIQKDKGQLTVKDKGKSKESKKKDKSTKTVEAQNKPSQADEAHSKKVAGKADDDQAELKLIRQTLFYKLMAQNYSYDNFVKDIKQSKMKEFTISDLINLMGAEPFMLVDHQVETVLMYIFSTDSPDGTQALSSKDFMKKMKKFIGKTKQVNQEHESQNLRVLSDLVEKDLTSGQKILKQFKKVGSGDKTLTVQQFSKVMETFKIKDKVLQTAIAHIAYVSQDLNTLNYDLFLKRFISEQ